MRIITEWRARRRTLVTSGLAVVLDLFKPKREPRGVSSVLNISADQEQECLYPKGHDGILKTSALGEWWVGE
jgi:hypothetical protein